MSSEDKGATGEGAEGSPGWVATLQEGTVVAHPGAAETMKQAHPGQLPLSDALILGGLTLHEGQGSNRLCEEALSQGSGRVAWNGLAEELTFQLRAESGGRDTGKGDSTQ